MNLVKFIAAQLRQPSGFFGRHVMVHLLNRGNVPINSLALQVLRLTPEDHVLEVGFGGGDLIARMARVLIRGHVTGVDLSRDAVEFCAKRFERLIEAGTIDLHCANVEELPSDAGTFNKACTVNTIYFWPAPLVALAQIRRVLKEDGVLVVCFGPRTLMEKRRVMRHGFTLYDPEEVKALFTTAGFRDVQLVLGKYRFGECIAATGKK
jgi:SAM-dependent methyltransferase